jgi:hypothetical protein
VAWTECLPTDFAPGYWLKIWNWYNEGGDHHVAAYLAALDISDFDPKAPPRKTPAFWSIVNANRTSEETELQDALDKLGNPPAVTIAGIRDAVPSGDVHSLWYWLGERKNRKAANHRLEKCGYRPVNNPDAENGLWRVGGKRQVVYAKDTLPLGEQQAAAQALQRETAEKEQVKPARAPTITKIKDEFRVMAGIPEGQTELEQAKNLLTDRLTGGDGHTVDIEWAAKRCGIGPSVLEQACKELGVQTYWLAGSQWLGLPRIEPAGPTGPGPGPGVTGLTGPTGGAAP